MTKNNIFQNITIVAGVFAFVIMGMVINSYISQTNNQTQQLSETQQIINFLSLANNAQDSGLYGEADPESLQFNLIQLKESLSQTIQTQEDANLYMIYWAATAVNNCVHSRSQTQSLDACIQEIKKQVQTNIAQMSNKEQQILIESAESWNALTAIVEYYNIFMKNNFVHAIQQETQPTTKQLTNELDAEQNTGVSS